MPVVFTISRNFIRRSANQIMGISDHFFSFGRFRTSTAWLIIGARTATRTQKLIAENEGMDVPGSFCKIGRIFVYISMFNINVFIWAMQSINALLIHISSLSIQMYFRHWPNSILMPQLKYPRFFAVLIMPINPWITSRALGVIWFAGNWNPKLPVSRNSKVNAALVPSE